MTLADEVLGYALSLGFDSAATMPLPAPRTQKAYLAWLEAGYHGEMAYMAERAALRLAPQSLAPDARSMIVTIANYAQSFVSIAGPDEPCGQVARYAWAADYHDVLKAKLFRLDAFLRDRTGRESLGKACVDSVPLLERDFAEQAGLGFTGRNTCLITPGLGSWTFLAALLVPEQLETRLSPRAGHLGSARHVYEASLGSGQPPFTGCGSCTRCLDACPTRAFVADHILDARRCISYLTIELRGPIPRDLRPSMGYWVFGCDVCQAVCPYNRAAPEATMPGLQVAGRDITVQGAISLRELLALDEAAFRTIFKGTPVMRAKRRGLVRNACVAAGNSGDVSMVPHLLPLLADAEPLVRGHAAWALGRLGGWTAGGELREALAIETDTTVREEIELALEGG